MISIIDSGNLVNTTTSPMIPRAAVMVGLSTDSKPTSGVGNGWLFLEMDTSKKYLFDAVGETWREWA